jgi:hypothetical protein
VDGGWAGVEAIQIIDRSRHLDSEGYHRPDTGEWTAEETIKVQGRYGARKGKNDVNALIMLDLMTATIRIM